MFTVTCDNCGKRQLLFTSQIKHLINDDQGIVVIYECWCGVLGAYRTGNRVHARKRIVNATTGELLRQLTIDPSRDYQRMT